MRFKRFIPLLLTGVPLPRRLCSSFPRRWRRRAVVLDRVPLPCRQCLRASRESAATGTGTHDHRHVQTEIGVILSLLATLTWAPPAFAREVEEEKFVVVKAGRVITVSGQEYRPGMIVIADGRIKLVGQSLEYPSGAEIIDAGRATVMPGLVHPRTRFDLPDFNRNGVHGDLKAADEVIFSQIDFEELLKAGYTTVCFYPNGVGVPGLASVFKTGGPDDARKLKEDAYLRVTMNNPARDKNALREALKKADAEIEKVEKARKEWEKKQKEQAEAEKKKQEEEKKKQEAEKPKPDEKKAPATLEEEKPKEEPKKDDASAEKKEPEKFISPEMDPRYLPLIDLVQKKKGAAPALMELAQASDLLHLDDALKDREIDHFYYLSGWLPWRQVDYYHVADRFGEREARVILEPAIFERPYTVERYDLARALVDAGCKVAFASWNDSANEMRRIRERVALLVRVGFDREAALKALTLHPAQILGLGDRLGGVDKDKDADLIFLDGDPFDPRTQVTRVMILGEVVWDAEDEDE